MPLKPALVVNERDFRKATRPAAHTSVENIMRKYSPHVPHDISSSSASGKSQHVRVCVMFVYVCLRVFFFGDAAHEIIAGVNALMECCNDPCGARISDCACADPCPKLVEAEEQPPCCNGPCESRKPDCKCSKPCQKMVHFNSKDHPINECCRDPCEKRVPTCPCAQPCPPKIIHFSSGSSGGSALHSRRRHSSLSAGSHSRRHSSLSRSKSRRHSSLSGPSHSRRHSSHSSSSRSRSHPRHSSLSRSRSHPRHPSSSRSHSSRHSSLSRSHSPRHSSLSRSHSSRHSRSSRSHSPRHSSSKSHSSQSAHKLHSGSQSLSKHGSHLSAAQKIILEARNEASKVVNDAEEKAVIQKYVIFVVGPCTSSLSCPALLLLVRNWVIIQIFFFCVLGLIALTKMFK